MLEGGDEFMAVKPWLGSIKAPNKDDGESDINQASSLTRAPKTDVQLEWVYGYAGHTYPNNLFYSAAGDVVYPAAAVGVVLRVDRREGQRDGAGQDGKQAPPQGTVRFGADASPPSEVPCHKQRFYRRHEKDIAAVAVCPQRRFVATGDLVKGKHVTTFQLFLEAKLSSLFTPTDSRYDCGLQWAVSRASTCGTAAAATMWPRSRPSISAASAR